MGALSRPILRCSRWSRLITSSSGLTFPLSLLIAFEKASGRGIRNGRITNASTYQPTVSLDHSLTTKKTINVTMLLASILLSCELNAALEPSARDMKLFPVLIGSMIVHKRGRRYGMHLIETGIVVFVAWILDLFMLFSENLRRLGQQIMASTSDYVTNITPAHVR
jgi:hypothetical protein